MKNIQYILILIFSLAVMTSCQEDDLTIGDLITPSNIDITVTYLDDPDGDGTYEETAAPGLGSALVRFSASASDATSYHVVVQGVTKLQTNGMVEHNFTVLGNNTYAVTVVAYGTGGISSSRTIEVDVLALYEPPADLLGIQKGAGQRRLSTACVGIGRPSRRVS